MEEKDIHLSDYLSIIKKRKGVVIIFAALIFAATAVVTFSLPPQYIANTKLLIEDIKSDSLSSLFNDNRIDPKFQTTQHQIIKSKSVAKKVVKQLSLDTKYVQAFIDIKGAKSQKSSSFKDRLKRRILRVLGLMGMHTEEEAFEEQAADRKRSLEDIIADMILKNMPSVSVPEIRNWPA